MYVIIHKNRVILGILPWKASYFMTVLKSRYRINSNLPIDEPVESVFPLQIDSDTVIKKCIEIERPDINPYVEQYEGPTFEITDVLVTASYQVKDLPIEDARYNIKQLLANQRYDKEISGTTINGVSIPTDRESRNTVIMAYVGMQEGSTIEWKFPEGWRTLTKPDMANIVTAINAHVQSAFFEEQTKASLVDSCLTKQQLLDLNYIPTNTVVQ